MRVNFVDIKTRFKYLFVFVSIMKWMTETDKKSLVALTIYPGMSGKDVSELSGISQSSLLRSRRRLLETGIIKPVKVPNFGRIGFNIVFSSFGIVRERRGDGVVPRIPGVFQLVLERGKGFGY